MRGEIISRTDLEVYQDIGMPDGGRIVLANPAYGWIDRSTDAANHNVFRVDRQGNIVWQVRRDERGFINWDVRNRHAKEDDPQSEGYLDTFAGMGTQFFRRHPTGDQRPYQPKFSYELFDTYVSGSVLGLHTFEFEYDLDPETGIATCTGVPVK